MGAPGVFITAPGEKVPLMVDPRERIAEYKQVLERVNARLAEEDSPRRLKALQAKKAELEGDIANMITLMEEMLAELRGITKVLP